MPTLDDHMAWFDLEIDAMAREDLFARHPGKLQALLAAPDQDVKTYAEKLHTRLEQARGEVTDEQYTELEAYVDQRLSEASAR